MTQEHKVLLQDLCARLPYRIKASYYEAEAECETWDEIEGITIDGYVDIGQYSLPIERIKPYLFPLSSMTEKQKMELTTIKTYVSLNKNREFLLFDWLNKNHLDYRGLIPMGLALDATGLNIY